MQETNRIEFKRGLSNSFERAVVSFLNYPGGGEILVGVDDEGKAVGVENADSIQRKIVDRIRNNIGPQTLGLFDVILAQKEGKDIVRVIVSCGPERPYYIRKLGRTEEGCFIRVGSSTQSMTERTIVDMFTKRQPMTLQSMPSPRTDLTFEQLRIYYQEKKLNLNEKFIESLSLRHVNGGFNYAAYLLADENGESIKVAAYAGKSKKDLHELSEYGYGCLITATKRLLDRMDSENRTFAKITYEGRQQRELVDKTALREAIINAVVHNDYSKGVPLVEIFTDRIVVTSCGGLVADLSEEDFFSCLSMPRNRELMRVFRDVEMVEQIGSGMTSILEAYDRSIFKLTPGFTIVTFPFAEPFITPNDKTIGKINGKINEEDDPIIGTLYLDPAATIPKLSDSTGLSQRTVARRLREYQDAGIIRRDGARKNGKWVVIDTPMNLEVKRPKKRS